MQEGAIVDYLAVLVIGVIIIFISGMFTTAFRREAKKWKDWFRDRLSKIGLYTSTPSTLEQEYLG